MYRHRKKQKASVKQWRLLAFRWFFVLLFGVVVFRLFTLQVVNAEFYTQLASGQHSFYQELFAERGSVYVQEWNSGDTYLAATNAPKAFVYADPRQIEDPAYAAEAIGKILDYEIITSDEKLEQLLDTLTLDGDGVAIGETEDVQEELEAIESGPTDYEVLLTRLSKSDDPYEPIIRGLSEEKLEQILDLELAGIHYILEKERSYPEENIGGHILGFVGKNSEGEKVGRYGVEGYFDDFLAGQDGYIDSDTDSTGRWIGVGSRVFEPAVHGGDLVLTVDRNIQYYACQALAKGVERFDADGGTVVIIEPSTGAVIAMCSVPDFDPNTYNEVEDISVYNNIALQSYEPGSVFKPLIMAAGIDQGVVSPNTIYEDTGAEKIDQYTIRNSDLKAYGWQTMTEVLEKSLNTGMIYVMRQMDFASFKKYVEWFGFGSLSGIELGGESAGDISSLEKQHELYYATASYGQGITATPLQLASAYGALANDGVLMEPYIVEEERFSNGDVEETKPTAVRQVISKKTATTVGAMMVSVIENGHGTLAQVPGYYLAGKTGTAQVAAEDGQGYATDHTKATFAGFGPVDDPKFAMVLMLDRPRATPWAADTAAPIWGEIAEYMLQYFEVIPRRSVE